VFNARYDVVQTTLVFRLKKARFPSLDARHFPAYRPTGRPHTLSVLCSIDCRRAVNQAQQQVPTPAGTLQDVAPDATPARSPSGHQSKDLNDSVSTVEVRHGVE
jgi:hypothetical protein